MGSCFAAFRAGHMPKVRPTAVLMPKPNTMDHSGAAAGKSKAKRTRKAIPSPIAMPMPPPMPVRVTASTRNWAATSLRVAPIAFRTPISRVRSVTVTSMMFITPTPPTSRAMPAMKIMAAAIPPVICWKD